MVDEKTKKLFEIDPDVFLQYKDRLMAIDVEFPAEGKYIFTRRIDFPYNTFRVVFFLLNYRGTPYVYGSTQKFSDVEELVTYLEKMGVERYNEEFAPILGETSIVDEDEEEDDEDDDEELLDA